MHRTLVLCAILLALIPSAALAQPACQPTAFVQTDMAGTYLSFESRMRVVVYPCGGVNVMWSNEYGTHETVYAGVERMPNGGILARVLYPDPMVRSLDGRNVVGLKPAEPGFIQVLTVGPFADDLKIYRLQKMPY